MKARYFFAIIILSVASITVVNAQPPPPGNPGVDPDVPITGIEILIGAGGALGLKKLLNKRKKSNC